MKLYFDDEAFDGQLQRSVGKADSGMANIGECLAIAGQITGGDRDSWYRAWSGFADRLVEQGRCGPRGRPSGERPRLPSSVPPSTSDRPSSSTATIWTVASSALRTRRASAPSGMCFRSSTYHAEVLSGDVSGYFFAPSDAGGPRPTILHIGGYDGTAEELFASVEPALSARVTHSPRSTDRGRAPCSTTSGSRCVPIGKRWSLAWSTDSLSTHRSIPMALCSSVDRSAACSPRGEHRANRVWPR